MNHPEIGIEITDAQKHLLEEYTEQSARKVYLKIKHQRFTIDYDLESNVANDGYWMRAMMAKALETLIKEERDVSFFAQKTGQGEDG